MGGRRMGLDTGLLQHQPELQCLRSVGAAII